MLNWEKRLGWLYYLPDGVNPVVTAPLAEADRAELRELLRVAGRMARSREGPGDCKLAARALADAAERWEIGIALDPDPEKAEDTASVQLMKLRPSALTARDPHFLDDLSDLLNRHKNASGTPDFLLATFLQDVLRALERTLAMREEWYGRGNEEENAHAD